jgi:hypothetical protein
LGEVNAALKERWDNATEEEKMQAQKEVAKDMERYQEEREEFNEKGYYTRPDGSRSNEPEASESKKEKKGSKGVSVEDSEADLPSEEFKPEEAEAKPSKKSGGRRKPKV